MHVSGRYAELFGLQKSLPADHNDHRATMVRSRASEMLDCYLRLADRSPCRQCSLRSENRPAIRCTLARFQCQVHKPDPELVAACRRGCDKACTEGTFRGQAYGARHAAIPALTACVDRLFLGNLPHVRQVKMPVSSRKNRRRRLTRRHRVSTPSDQLFQSRLQVAETSISRRRLVQRMRRRHRPRTVASPELRSWHRGTTSSTAFLQAAIRSLCATGILC